MLMIFGSPVIGGQTAANAIETKGKVVEELSP